MDDRRSDADWSGWRPVSSCDLWYPAGWPAVVVRLASAAPAQDHF